MQKKRLILLYNNSEYLPFTFSSGFYLKRWEVSMDKSLLEQASVVVFHLPTLADAFTDEIRKREGQFWIAWRQSKEESLISDIRITWNGVFDLYISYPPQFYWKCATSFDFQLCLSQSVYPLLEKITNWFRKVDFMIIGTQKGGSTALHEYLHQHPSCWGSFFKETDFFLFPSVYMKGLPWYMEYMWKECIPFRYSLSDCLLFESTTWYSYWHEVPERLFEYNPHLKFIFLVRNPIDRAYSQYNMLVRWTKSKLLYEYSLFPNKKNLNVLLDKLLDTQKYPFEYWIDLEIEKNSRQESISADFFPDFLHRGFYGEQLERYYQFFSKENILVLESNELRFNRMFTLRKIEQFLNIPSVDWDTINLEDKFVSQYATKMTYDIRKKLISFFEPYNKKFYNLIGKDFGWE